MPASCREERRRHVEAGRVTLQSARRHHERRALLLADLDILRSCSSWLSSTTGPMSVPAFSASSTIEPLHALDQGGDEASWMPSVDDQARRRRAALAGREEGTIDGGFDRHLKIGIVQHHERVLAAHFELDLLHRRFAMQVAAILRPVRPSR